MGVEPYDPVRDRDPVGTRGDLVVHFDRVEPWMKTGFHGTNRTVEHGQLRPDVGRTDKEYSFSGNNTVNYWASGPGVKSERSAENAAWLWARAKTPTSGDPSAGRPRVYGVTAATRPRRDPNLGLGNDFDPASESIPVATTHADVTKTVWTPPPSAEAAAAGRGVQGTLEHINWNQFGLPNVANWRDATHQYRGDTSEVEELERSREDAVAEADYQARLPTYPPPEVPGQGELFIPTGPSAGRHRDMADAAKWLKEGA